jgi:4-hydroxy-2-oxoheptanedioate aldolase
MRSNTAKQKLLLGKPVIGAEVILGATLAGEALSRAGFDFVQVDMQHGSWDIQGTMSAIRSICLASAIPIVRVQQNDFFAIGTLLDRGALGIVVPMVETVEQAERAVRAVKYPPRGTRSWSPFGALIHGSGYEEQANDETLLMVQIETGKGAGLAEQIMETDGVDGCWIGPYDLAKSMGIVFGDDEHEQVISQILQACRNTGKVPGIWANMDSIEQRIRQGFLYVTAGSDNEFMMREAARTLSSLQNLF